MTERGGRPTPVLVSVGRGSTGTEAPPAHGEGTSPEANKVGSAPEANKVGSAPEANKVGSAPEANKVGVLHFIGSTGDAQFSPAALAGGSAAARPALRSAHVEWALLVAADVAA